MASFGTRLKNAWNVFLNNSISDFGSGYSSSIRPDRVRLSRGNEKSIITAIYNRIALDCANIIIEHVRLDDNNRFIDVIDSGLNECLSVEANIDQTGRAFIQDIVLSMLDEGCIAIVPVDTVGNPYTTSSYDILSMRTGQILEWYPNEVKVRIYNDRTGRKEDIKVSKRTVKLLR